MQRALVLHPRFRRRAASSVSDQARLEEACGLASAIDLSIIEALIIPVISPKPSTLFGKGKVEEIAHLAEEKEIGLAVIDGALSPVQQRNLEKAWNCKVIDRTALILEIFGARARTAEGKLQVELAALEYQKSRLVRSWTHLERQRGGFGFLGGPGESQIELDRRMIRDRIAKLKRELENVKRTRALHREKRRRVPYPAAALVGYTNAGKSTLFNRLTGAKVTAEDKLFATLDPTMRAVRLPSGMTIILSDTVGFVSNLPTELVAAFRATLEEVLEADILLHVRDAAHPAAEAQKEDVEAVIALLFGDAEKAEIVEVLNKADLLPPNVIPPGALGISALTGQGVDRLIATLDAKLSARARRDVDFLLPPDAGSALAWLHRHGQITREEADEDGFRVHARLSPEDVHRFEKRFGVEAR